MSNPFPGMNPYLENPEIWPEVHHLLISILAETLNPQLLPKYRVAIEKRVYQLSGEDVLLVGIPDVTIEGSKSSRIKSFKPSNIALVTPTSSPISVTLPIPIEVREGYLEVREIATQEVITVIEILSPSNKRPGKGRDIYQQKRENILSSYTHLVEIDLLRTGDYLPMIGNNIEGDYHILISPREYRPRADLYLFNLPDEIPTFALPIRSEDHYPIINLGSLLNKVYERAGYDVVIDYKKNPSPPLSSKEQEWLNSLLKDKGLR
jgi:hypothetical protein